MMKIKDIKIFAFAVLGLASMLLSCNNSTSSDFEQLTKIERFPVEDSIDVSNIETLDISSNEINDIRIVDSLLVVSVNSNAGFWHIFSLPNVDSLGSVLNVGIDQCEFPACLTEITASFKVDKSKHIIANIPVANAAKFISVDLSSLSDSAALNESFDASLVPTCISANELADGASLRYYIVPEHSKIERVLVKDGKEIENEAMAMLNSKTVSDMSVISRLFTRVALQKNGSKVAEISEFSANINIWSTENGEAKSLIISGVDDSEDAIANRIADNKPVYTGALGFDRFFIAQRVDYSPEGVAKSLSVEFIDWTGNALGRLILNSANISRVDIDEHNGYLYIMDAKNNAVKRVNITDFLSRL